MRAICLDREGAFTAEYSATEEPSPSRWLNLQKLERDRPASEEDFARLPVLCQGFYDSHMHPSWIARLRDQVICHGKSAEAILKEIKSAPGQQRLYAFGWEEAALKIPLEDFRRELEKISRPLVAYRVCGHMAFLSGQGFLKDAELQAAVAQLEKPPLAPGALRETLQALQSQGIDECADLLVAAADFSELRRAAPDLLLFGDVHDFEKFEKLPERPRYMKYFLDGSLGARTAWLSEKYSDHDTIGLQIWRDEELTASLRRSLAAGYLLAFHAIGDAALDQLLRVADELRDSLRQAPANGEFHRVEHLQVCRDDQIEILREQGFWSLGLQPSHREADAAFCEQRLGARRLSAWAYRLGAFAQAELKISLGSDAPITSYEPRLTLQAVMSDSRPHERLPLSRIYELFCVEGRQNAGKSAKKLQAGSKAWLSTLHL